MPRQWWTIRSALTPLRWSRGLRRGCARACSLCRGWASSVRFGGGQWLSALLILPVLLGQVGLPTQRQSPRSDANPATNAASPAKTARADSGTSTNENVAAPKAAPFGSCAAGKNGGCCGCCRSREAQGSSPCSPKTNTTAVRGNRRTGDNHRPHVPALRCPCGGQTAAVLISCDDPRLPPASPAVSATQAPSRLTSFSAGHPLCPVLPPETPPPEDTTDDLVGC